MSENEMYMSLGFLFFIGLLLSAAINTSEDKNNENDKF